MADGTNREEMEKLFRELESQADQTLTPSRAKDTSYLDKAFLEHCRENNADPAIVIEAARAHLREKIFKLLLEHAAVYGDRCNTFIIRAYSHPQSDKFQNAIDAFLKILGGGDKIPDSLMRGIYCYSGFSTFGPPTSPLPDPPADIPNSAGNIGINLKLFGDMFGKEFPDSEDDNGED